MWTPEFSPASLTLSSCSLQEKKLPKRGFSSSSTHDVCSGRQPRRQEEEKVRINRIPHIN